MQFTKFVMASTWIWNYECWDKHGCSWLFVYVQLFDTFLVCYDVQCESTPPPPRGLRFSYIFFTNGWEF